ncbi:BQ2448_7557 [Microbotryum intermedium]|uniref:BQ2448_7557 protein n=1 Tax=Microbotryum intermedium TaxID=269621 RepID=A0A238FTH7_9BASI|nr:BQ2448_7557 [Microbotryum intermedium]
MGQAESQPIEHDDASLPSPSLPTSRYAPQNATIAQVGLAFHVLRVAERSPADESGIEPFFDFVVGVNGRPLGDDIDLLMRMSKQFEERQISLQIYSTKRKELRDVPIVPSRAWSSTLNKSGGQNSNDDGGGESGEGGASLLGLSLRLCDPQHALDQVWHVLEILEGSPAQSAGLVPFGDWIIAYSGGILRGEGDFYDVVEAHVDKPLRLFVYNADYDVTRETILIPNRSWGGEGLLGCGVGYGLLHRIPKPQDRARGGSTTDAALGEGEMPTSHGMAGIGLISSPPTPQSTITTSLTNPGGRSGHPLSPIRYAPPPPRPQATMDPVMQKSIYPSAGGTLQHTHLNIDGETTHRPQDSVASTTYSDLSPPPSTTRGRETLVETPTIPVPKAFEQTSEEGSHAEEEEEEGEDGEGEDHAERYDERYGSYATEGVQVIPISHEEDEEGKEDGDFVVQTRRTYGAEWPEEQEDEHDEEDEGEQAGDGGGHFMARALAARSGARLNVRTDWSNGGRGGSHWGASDRNGDEGDEDDHDHEQGQTSSIPPSPWKPPPSPALQMESRSYV